jgi:hypothetical protein
MRGVFFLDGLCSSLQENRVHSSVNIYSSVLRNITVLYSLVSRTNKDSGTNKHTWQGLRGALGYVHRFTDEYTWIIDELKICTGSFISLAPLRGA